MARFVGGHEVESGYYVNVKSLAVVALPAAGRLPGGEADRFTQVPWPVLLVAAPVVGGLFALAYPVVGASVMAYGLVRRALTAAGAGAAGVAESLAPAPLPGEAHLTGKPGEAAAPRDEKLEALEREVARKREEP